MRELKRNPWKSIPSKSEAKIKNPVTHLMEYQSYLEFSLNLDGYMDTLRVLENELGCYNLSTIVNKLIRAKQEVDNANNKRKLVDMGDRDDEDMLFKRKSADTQTNVEAGSVTVSEGAAAAADRVDSSDNIADCLTKPSLKGDTRLLALARPASLTAVVPQQLAQSTAEVSRGQST